MVRGKTSLLKIIFSVTVLNSISLLLFFFHPDFFRFNPHDHPEKHHCCAELDISTSKTLKSWPVLPSYISWTQHPNVAPRSCEGYFGNGFTKKIDVLRLAMDNQKSGGWFRCFYSATLRSSICEAGGLRMVPDRIRMSAGGESLETVMGRKEEDELPRFEPGAFEVDGGDGVEHGRKLVEDMFLSKYMPQGKTMTELVRSIRVVKSAEFKCSEWVEEPTLLITRFEYANIFHTVTDWYSAYVASRVTGLPSRPHVVFVDGHCKTQLEETWQALFSSMRYAKNSTGPLCFRHAVLTPLGYETALFKGLSEGIQCKGSSHSKNPHETARLSEFGEMFASAFGLPVDRFQNRIENPAAVHDVLFVRREDYLAHPRHGGRVQSRLSNEQEVFDYLKNWVSGYPKCKINLVNGLFAHMSMKEQVEAIRNASVVIGAHGAGLTHVIAAKRNVVVLEIISSEYRRPHFALISQWKGLEYHAIDLSGSYADPGEVAGKLKSILRSLGC